MLAPTSYSSKDDNIQIRAATLKDYQCVLDFMDLYFSHDEPLSICRKPGEELEFPEGDLIAFIEHGTCLLAVVKDTDELVGLTVSAPKNLMKVEQEVPKRNDSTGVKIDKFLTSLEHESNLFERYNVERVLYIFTVCVKTEMLGKGIGARLCIAVHDLGKAMGFELLAADCTSFYSARMQERLGWDSVCTVYYKDYQDEDGKQVFNPPSPHECCKTYAVRL